MTVLEALPSLRVELDGAELDRSAGAALANVRVLQQLSLPALCELRLVELNDALGAFAPGTPLRVLLDGTEQPLFVGEITAIRHAYGPGGQREVHLRAFDPLHRLRKRQPVRAHVELDLRNLALELVDDLGLTVEMDDPGPVWPRIMQWRQSDLELLSEVAASCGLYFTARDGKLHFTTLAGAGDEIDLILWDTLLEADFDASTEPACRSVDVRAWNSWTAAEHEAVADVPRVGREIELDPAPADVGSPGRRTLVDEAAYSSAHASALAQAELDRRVAGEVTVQGVATGNVRLQPGCAVRLRGVAAPLEGRYIVTSVVHSIDRHSGFRSKFGTSPPAAPARARACVTTLGIVLDADDPQKIGRVRVSLPNYCDVETDWLEVLSPGGGRGKGLVTVPDSGDRVLLLLPREDPAQAVVLGGLYAAEGPPDTGVRDRKVLRYTFVTRGGQRLYLEEEEKSVRIENGTGSYLEISPGHAQIANDSGSYVELTPQRVRLHSNADLEIEAPGKALTFRSARVDFRTE